MEPITREDFVKYCKGKTGFLSDTDCEIINEQSKILADIFDVKNQKICRDCRRNFEFKGKYKIKKGTDGYQTRVYRAREIKVKNMGCCDECAKAMGHYRNPSFEEGKIMFENFKKYFKFNKNTGFFNTRLQTCVLPRQLRSSTCLGYHCHAMKITLKESIKIDKAKRIIETIKRDLHIIN